MNEINERLSFIKNLELKSKLFLGAKNSSDGLDEEGARLLEAIKKFGSISMAAKHAGRDYRLAWMKIDELEKAFGFKIVDRVLGGLGGGSARLTLEGDVLLQKYLLAESKLRKFSESEEILKPDLSIMGSHCYALEILVEMLGKNFFVEYASVGSENGLKLVLSRAADITGVHMFDRKSGEYNKFLLRKPGFGKKIALIKGYSRMQGIIVKRGNPKNVNSIEDLLRKDVVFVNRNAGSGTRYLLDSFIEKIGLEKGLSFNELVRRIRGYDSQAKSHMEVGVAVNYGKADAGVGIKAVARAFNLDFIPLQREQFDFVVLKKKMGEKNIEKFIEMLSSKNFQSRVCEKDLGIQIDEEAGKVISGKIK